MSPGVNKCFNSFFVVSVIIVLSMMKNVQKCCGHCTMIKKKYWTLRNNGLNFKLQNRNAQDSISSRRFTDSVAVQYLGDPGLWDNLEELLAYILCRRTRSNIWPKWTFIVVVVSCCFSMWVKWLNIIVNFCFQILSYPTHMSWRA